MRRTDRECHNCKDAMYVQYDSELYCTECHYSPDGPARRNDVDQWKLFWKQREAAVERGERPYVVGSFKAAYF